jgi:hypothetical protein
MLIRVRELLARSNGLITMPDLRIHEFTPSRFRVSIEGGAQNIILANAPDVSFNQHASG